MVNGLELERQRFGLPGRVTGNEITAWIERSVMTLLRAYAPESKPRTRKTS